MKSRLIVVSNRLPYFQNANGEWERASGGLINAIEPIVIAQGGMWLGWDGHASQDFVSYQVNQLSAKTAQLPDSYSIQSVPLSKYEVSEFYDHFSNETLWALFHYFFEKCSIDDNAWQTYKIVNQRFARCIDQVARDDDTIWIHDYHLMLVPFFLKKVRPKLKLHFFLHIPFPHADIFSILPWGDRIIESLALCNSIGFHHPQYLSNFEDVVSSIGIKEPKFKSFVNPISIDFQLFDSASKKPSVIDKKDAFRKSIGPLQIIIGVDRIDYSKGIRERLLAIENLLETRPELKETFIYYQLTVPSRENVSSYQGLKKEVDELVGRINGSYSTETWIPVHYHYGTAEFEQLVAHYMAADIALVTPLRDGMNLVCKEYVASHSDERGVLILSKFAGAISEIKDCIAINPYSMKDVKHAIIKALTMPEEQREKNMRKMRETIKNHDILSWWQYCSQYF